MTDNNGPVTAAQTSPLITSFGVGSQNLLKELGSDHAVDMQGFDSRFDDIPELRGDRAVKLYREMRRNDGLIGAITFAIKAVLAGAPYLAEAPNDSAEAKRAADFLDECREDMSHPWADMLDDSFEAVPYGWESMEVTYKQRLGLFPAKGLSPSKHNDGLLAWRKIAHRDQAGLVRWVTDEHGGIQGMVHRTPDGGEVTIPIWKMILFRAMRQGNNPEGYSMLRNAVRAWRFKKNLEWVEAVTFERMGMGLPVVEMPMGADGRKEGTDYANAKNLVQHVRTDSYHGVVLPPPMGESPNHKWGFRLEATKSNPMALDIAIRRWGSEITTSVLAHWINLGMQSRGSYALSRDDRDLWHIALSSINRKWEETLNRHLVHRLFLLNYSTFPNPENWPSLRIGDISQHDIDKVRTYVSDLIDRDALRLGLDDRNRLRALIGWPDEAPDAEATARPTPPPAQRDETILTSVEAAVGKPVVQWSEADWTRAADVVRVNDGAAQ